MEERLLQLATLGEKQIKSPVILSVSSAKTLNRGKNGQRASCMHSQAAVVRVWSWPGCGLDRYWLFLVSALAQSAGMRSVSVHLCHPLLVVILWRDHCGSYRLMITSVPGCSLPLWIVANTWGGGFVPRPSWNFRMHIYVISAAKEQGQAQKEGRDAKLSFGIWLPCGPKRGASAV